MGLRQEPRSPALAGILGIDSAKAREQVEFPWVLRVSKRCLRAGSTSARAAGAAIEHAAAMIPAMITYRARPFIVRSLMFPRHRRAYISTKAMAKVSF